MVPVQKKRGRRLIALFLCLSMAVSVWEPVTYAAGETEETETGLCPHHTVHTEECGYEEPVEEQPCGHVHDENCGYEEQSEETVCTHEHDESCGYQEASEGSPCTYVCDICNGTETEDEEEDPEESGGLESGGGKSDGPETGGEETDEEDPVEEPSYALTEEQTYTAESEGAADFTAVIPAGTVFYGPDGEAADLAELSVAMKVQYFGEEDPVHSENQALIDSYVGYRRGEGAGALDLQFWRVWFEDENGDEYTIKLPENGQASVTVEYQAGENGDYPAALRGEQAEGCLKIMDLGAPKGGAVEETRFSETEDYALDVFADEENSFGPEVSVVRFTYYIDADENGTSAWGNLMAFFTMEPEHAALMMALTEIDRTVLEELANQRIYPGEESKDENGKVVWTVYDAPDEKSASIKATVIFPEGTEIPEDHYLYIRKVDENESYYPSKEALENIAGQVNNVQCYAIHWVHVYQNEGKWTYGLETGSVLDEETLANVQIEYLKSDAYLEGHQANRKLQVYNSRKSDGSELEDASTPTAVTANTNAYTGFTFETNRGGPYVFVSKYLYEGYVNSLTINKITDGSAPFDADDKAGNDSGDSNKIVRSYDTIQYNFAGNFGARSNTATATSAVLDFEMTMEADITEAVFDTGQMLWLGNSYTIEYLDQEGNTVLTQRPDGTYTDQNGKKVSLNELVSGSDEEDASYTTQIVSQRLRGKTTIEDDNNVLTANQTFSAAVQVLGAANGSMIQPTFKAWFEGNEDNYGSESGNGDEVHLAEKEEGNQIEAVAVEVSAAARLNLQLEENTNMTYRGWFDSSKGKEINSTNTDVYQIGSGTVTGAKVYELLENLAGLEENKGKSNPENFTDKENVCGAYLSGLKLEDYAEVFKNIRYGRLTGYGITLQVYNDAAEGQNTASKGFRGVSLPYGEISFDLALEAAVTQGGVTGPSDEYYAQLWEYNENMFEDKGNQGKNMLWNNLDSTKYASWAAPYNSGTNTSACYNGGEWKLKEDNENGYHFTVNSYDLNFFATGVNYPTHKAGNGSATGGYNTYIGCFSAGYVQVLNVFPRYQETLTMNTSITVKNLKASTTGGGSVEPDSSDSTGYAHETNQKDNMLTDGIPLYEPGGMTKANAFCDAGLYSKANADFTSKEYFLGTDFWNTSYDCSAFAGQTVTLVGAARIGAGDYQIHHMNMLQLFDSGALMPTGEKPKVVGRVKGTVKGETTILYAADPDYPNGYDTNDKKVMEYMNTVREEDLIYYENLEDLKKNNRTCVGVLAELRGWTISPESGYSTALWIPMKVSEDEKYLGKTVATVNTMRIWANAEDMKQEDGTYVSWKDGKYDLATGKNSVDGYAKVPDFTGAHYSGEVVNDSGDKAYVKTEYENGQFQFGTNTNGYVNGSSLLILGYKSEVDIEVDNGGDGSLPTYDLDKGKYTVNYHLKDIIAKVDNTNGKPQDTTTNLTVLSKLDTKRDDDGDDQRIMVTADSY